MKFKFFILGLLFWATCQLQAQDCSNFCVWPGDVNNNGIANHYDILPLGLAQGATGPFRSDENVDWSEKEAADWSDSFPVNGATYKHADSNGDGFVDEFDIFPIGDNFGEINDLYTGASEGNNIEGPDLTATLDMTTYTDGQTITVTISLGSEDNPVSGLTGLAFSLDIDTTYIQQVIEPITWNLGFIGPASTVMTFDKWEPGISDRIHFAFAKTDGSTIEGFGELLTVELIVIDDLSLRFAEPQDYQIQILDVLGIDMDETDLQITSRGDEATLLTTTSVKEINWNKEWIIAPNPVENILTISHPNEKLNHVEVVDFLGKVWYSEPYSSSDIPFGNIPPGMYVILIHTSNQIYSKTLFKRPF